MAEKSRAEYFRELRKKKRQFVALIDNEKMGRLEKCLEEKGETKVSWLNRKIDEELGK